MTPKTAPRKAPSVSTLRRRFLAEQKVTDEGPLSGEEIKRLHELTEAASKSNHRLIDAGERLNNIRCAQCAAEMEFADTLKENHAIHGEIAPLLHRLRKA